MSDTVLFSQRDLGTRDPNHIPSKLQAKLLKDPVMRLFTSRVVRKKEQEVFDLALYNKKHNTVFITFSKDRSKTLSVHVTDKKHGTGKKIETGSYEQLRSVLIKKLLLDEQQKLSLLIDVIAAKYKERVKFQITDKDVFVKLIPCRLWYWAITYDDGGFYLATKDSNDTNIFFPVPAKAEGLILQFVR